MVSSAHPLCSEVELQTWAEAMDWEMGFSYRRIHSSNPEWASFASIRNAECVFICLGDFQTTLTAANNKKNLDNVIHLHPHISKSNLIKSTWLYCEWHFSGIFYRSLFCFAETLLTAHLILWSINESRIVSKTLPFMPPTGLTAHPGACLCNKNFKSLRSLPAIFVLPLRVKSSSAQSVPKASGTTSTWGFLPQSCNNVLSLGGCWGILSEVHLAMPFYLMVCHSWGGFPHRGPLMQHEGKEGMQILASNCILHSWLGSWQKEAYVTVTQTSDLLQGEVWGHEVKREGKKDPDRPVWILPSLCCHHKGSHT